MQIILVIDAQGGGIGKQIIQSLKKKEYPVRITAVGTNTAATMAMLNAGADIAVTGENAVKVNARNADIIIGPIGIVIANSLYGEITPEMALAIAQSRAVRILLPINRCENIIAGVENLNLSYLIDKALEEVSKLVDTEKRLYL
ncbi:MAG: DUF3842 family protein [Erysipelotrichaceae bacterium]|nr:DUF3842 family protein [Erysipelotrichaceae bacterium]